MSMTLDFNVFEDKQETVNSLTSSKYRPICYQHSLLFIAFQLQNTNLSNSGCYTSKACMIIA